MLQTRSTMCIFKFLFWFSVSCFGFYFIAMICCIVQLIQVSMLGMIYFLHMLIGINKLREDNSFSRLHSLYSCEKQELTCSGGTTKVLSELKIQTNHGHYSLVTRWTCKSFYVYICTLTSIKYTQYSLYK